MNVYCTYYRGQYLASICGHWEREAYPLHHIHQGPIAVCSRTNTIDRKNKTSLHQLSCTYIGAQAKYVDGSMSFRAVVVAQLGSLCYGNLGYGVLISCIQNLLVLEEEWFLSIFQN